MIESEVFHAHRLIETPASLWQIVGECAQKDCGRRYAVYTWYLSEATTDAVISLVLKLNPTTVCAGKHNMLWRAEAMKAMKFDF